MVHLKIRGEPPTVTITTQGRVMLNRPAADFFESAWIGKVVLYWDAESCTLSIKATRGHAEEHVLYFGGESNTPCAFSAKTALASICYDFRERRTFLAKFVPEIATIEINIAKECLK